MPFSGEYGLGAINGFHYPPQGSVEEISLFHQLQKRFIGEYDKTFPGKLAANYFFSVININLG